MNRFLFLGALVATLFAGSVGAQTYLLNEAFTTFPPASWTVTNGGTSTVVWTGTTVGPGWSNGTLNGSAMAMVDADSGGGTAVVTTTLESAAFNGTTAAGSLFVSFSQYFELYAAGETGTLQIYNGTSWIQVYQASATTGDWAPYADNQLIDISAYKNASNRLRFVYTDAGNWGYHWALDDVRVLYYTGPEMDVQRPAGTANSIASGGQSQVGTATAATPTNFTWTVQNQGSSSLTHTVSIAGSPAPANCTPGTPTLAASTAAGATSTLTVPVTPTAAGLFTFRISIANNDTTGGENPYTVDVIGMVLGGNILFYGGDLDGVDSLVNGRGFDVPNDVQVFDNFIVPAGPNWNVTQVFSKNTISSIAGATFTADWEIRTGMSAGVGGTLVSSGTGVACAVYPTGGSAFGSPEYMVIAQLPSPLSLAPNTYYINVRPVRVGNVGRSYVTTTSGTNGVGTPLTDGVAFLHEVTGTQFGGIVYGDMASLVAPYDFSMGVRGTTGAASPLLTVSMNTVVVPTTTAGTAGTASSFTVSGSNLTPASGSVTLTLVSTPAGIEFRNATASGTFGTGVVTINYTGGTFASQTIEVRFASTGTATTYTGSITAAGGGATSQVVNLSGTVTSASSPTLSVSTNAVVVPTTSAGTAGTAATFTVSGSNLTPASGSVTLTLISTPAGIEFRNATAAGTFGTGVVTINYTGGAFAAQTIEVRFASTATATTYTGSITAAGGGATNQVVTLSGTVNSASTPTLAVSTNAVTVPTTSTGTAGTAASFTVSGSNLTPASGSVTLTLVSTPAGIEFRNATAAGTFGTGVVTINYTGGAFAAQAIEVRFASTATAAAYSGSITAAGGGATNQVVNLSGTVTAGGTLTIVTTTLPNGTVGTTYNGTITAQNGTGPYTWSLASGTLPAGVTLNTGATGLTTTITGTPTTAGVFTFTVQVADSASATDTQLYNVTINAAGGGGVGGGGGGGGGCSTDSSNAPWFVLFGLLAALVAVGRLRRAH